jgi:hypothetical protein
VSRATIQPCRYRRGKTTSPPTVAPRSGDPPRFLTPGCALDGLDDLDDGADLDDEGELDGVDGLDIGEEELAVVASNGMSLNGMSLNGMSLNGMSLNGMSLNGMSLNGMSLNGSQIRGTTSTGQALSGTGLVGAKMNGQLATGATLSLRIDSATALTGSNTDVWAYGMSYLSGSSWLPLCGTSGGVPVLAIPLQGTWNYGSGVTGGGSWTSSATSFTLGCRGAALAKCVELGYKPWVTRNGTLLRNHHQACTRSIRADYCGNGRSYTADGTQINIYDNVGLQADAAAWPVDAEWTPAGSRCVHSARAWPTQQTLPQCQLTKTSACGTWTSGALIINEYQKPPKS